jgi:hypothetical protein
MDLAMAPTVRFQVDDLGNDMNSIAGVNRFGK